MHAATSPVRPGDVLAGKYRVERVIGTGGMGVVVAATHLELLEPRAIKLMHATAASDGNAVERFVREARAASLLRSEHVARVYDVGRLPDGAPFMVMEYLEGADLSTALRRAGPMPVAEAVLYVLQAAEALAEAHGRGIVHRDVKPANLFLTLRPDGTPCVKVLDFGISKMAGATGEQELTQTNIVLGSPQYMSPEQMRSTRDVDARSDIWSLGVILYQLVTRQLPFPGHNITEIIAAVLQRSPLPPSHLRPDVPPALDQVIFGCLERDVSRRYSDMGELGRALAPFAPGGGALVDAIVRIAAARSSAALPSALSESQRLALTPRSQAPLSESQRRALGVPGPAGPGGGTVPVPPSVTVREGAPPPPQMPAAGETPPSRDGGTGAWGSTSAGSARRRSRAIVAIASAGGVAVGLLVAWGVSLTRPSPAPPSSAAATSGVPGASLTADVRPIEPPSHDGAASGPKPRAPAEPPPSETIPAPTAVASAEASATAVASATPTATPAASARAAPRVHKPAADPFGLERK